MAKLPTYDTLHAKAMRVMSMHLTAVADNLKSETPEFEWVGTLGTTHAELVRKIIKDSHALRRDEARGGGGTATLSNVDTGALEDSLKLLNKSKGA